MKKILVSVLTLFILLQTSICTISAAAVSAVPAESVSILQKREDYDAFLQYVTEELIKCTAKIDISSFQIPSDDAHKDAVFSMIYNDISIAFHVSQLSVTSDTKHIQTIQPKYNCSSVAFKKIYDACEQQAAVLLEGIADNDTLTDVQKALLIHDRIILACEYDYQNYLNHTIPAESYTICGVLTNGTAVCQGYAETYRYLLEKVGIDSWICRSEQLNHAWNIVSIDGTIYHVDVTWDDPVWDVSGRVYHNHFLLSSAEFSKKHNASDYSTAPASTTYDSAFWRNVNTAFQLINGNIYYINQGQEALVSYDGSKICTVTDTWWAGDNRYWVGNYTKLVSDGTYLYYSLTDTVFQYDPVTGSTVQFYTVSHNFGSNYAIYGLSCRDGKLICELNTSPNFDGNTKGKYSITIELPESPKQETTVPAAPAPTVKAPAKSNVPKIKR